MLLNGVNHVALLTNDTERFVSFYREVFGAEVDGRVDDLGLQAASLEAFEEIRRRLIERGAADEFVTDFGPQYSVFVRDPDGLEGEVCVPNPDAVPGVHNKPGTPAKRYVKD